MDLHIFSLSQSIDHVPQKPTYAIRIFSSFSPNEFELKKSQLYIRTKEYIFDDNDLSYQAGPIWISNDIADEIVNDFAEHKATIEALLVHCTRGINRSPAVAIALNDLFNLGHDSKELARNYRALNWFVYDKILEAGRRNGF